MKGTAGDVAFTFISDPAKLPALQEAISQADRLAIDTEVPISGPQAGKLRVMSLATRNSAGDEHAFVVDARDVPPESLAPILDGAEADAWNAGFDARVIDEAVWRSADTTPGLRWWDAMLADALIHQGRSGFTWYHSLAWATDHYLGLQAEGKGTIQISYDATSHLTEDQISYAAADAVHTLWVGDRIRAELTAAGLNEVCAIEQDARPFLDQMERSGLPFDWDGWQAELDRMERRRTDVQSRLAVLTGGGQGSLFDDSIEPSWNPSSDLQVRDALNKWAEAEVATWTKATFGQARPLTGHDSVTASVLREIGGDVCDALLSFRQLTKTLTTYGESMHEHLHDDGRLRPQYLQVVGTNTGRLASRQPNAQNFTPAMKPFCRPPDDDRVFVYADLSQAELRYLAQVADDHALREAFERGADVHLTTASSMFGIDPDRLATTDPDRLKRLRQQAKALNFGIAYGTGAASLARSLSAEGAETSVPEAERLLADYRRTYPGTARWAEQRIADIDAVAGRTSEIDWALTIKLAHRFPLVSKVRRELRAANHRWPSAEDVADSVGGMTATGDPAPGSPVTGNPRTGAGGSDAGQWVSGPDLVDEVRWTLRYSASVALLADESPFTFSSRTLSGRRQQFNLHLDRLFLAAVTAAVESSDTALIGVRRRFAAEHGLKLDPDQLETGAGIARQFDDRALRRTYITAIIDEVGDAVAYRLLGRAARERARAMVNAWRNAPIQGGVADIMLAAYGELHRALDAFPSAVPVQTVHDSVVVECHRSEAADVANTVRTVLETTSQHFCPDVAAKADVDIRSSLDDGDVLDEMI